jgi:hypothetical protein
MGKISKINLNLALEKIYIEGLVNSLYTDISNYGDEVNNLSLLIRENNEEESNNSILTDIVNDLNISKKFLFTFGTGIGAFVNPVNQLISGSGLSMTKEDIILLIITSIAILINDSDKDILKNKVKERGIESGLSGVKDFIKNTKKIINNVTEKTMEVTYSLSDILGFTFLLVPTTKILTKIINEYGLSVGNVKEMLLGITLASATFGVKSVLRKVKNKLS